MLVCEYRILCSSADVLLIELCHRYLYLLRVSELRLLLMSGENDACSGCWSGRYSGGLCIPLWAPPRWDLLGGGWPAGLVLIRGEAVVTNVVRHLVQLLPQLLLL